MCNGVDWVAAQIVARREPEPSRHQNPRPAGIIRPGSGTDVLLRFLACQPERWFFHPELVLALGRTKGEIDWALQYLAGQGRIQALGTAVPGRKSVLRYRLAAVSVPSVAGLAG